MPWKDWVRAVEVEPSLYAADFARLGEQIEILLRAGVRIFHFDVGDGVFGKEGGRLDALLDAVGVDHDVKTYPEAGHSFMSRHGPLLTAIERRLPVHGGFHEASAEDAWSRTLAFFARHLGPAA